MLDTEEQEALMLPSEYQPCGWLAWYTYTFIYLYIYMLGFWTTSDFFKLDFYVMRVEVEVD